MATNQQDFYGKDMQKRRILAEGFKKMQDWECSLHLRRRPQNCRKADTPSTDVGKESTSSHARSTKKDDRKSVFRLCSTRQRSKCRGCRNKIEKHSTTPVSKGDAQSARAAHPELSKSNDKIDNSDKIDKEKQQGNMDL